MKHITCTLLFAVVIVTFPATLNAENLINQSGNIFKFQQKLADNGNVHAQYKLAAMYETGDGVDASLDKALYWYGRAAKSGLKKAEHRNTYLMVKELGYDKKMHGTWLDSVISDANDHKPDAMLLLGQLYRQGLAVSKDLNKSLELLTYIGVLGDADVDDEIESIHAEISAMNSARRVAYKEKKTMSILSEPVIKTQAVQKAVKQKKKKTVIASSAKIDEQAVEKQRRQAEKVRRYEKAMMQLRREQRLIDEQQASVTNGAVISIDDEF